MIFFEVGKYYKYIGPIYDELEAYKELWFNDYMIAFFDRKPRKCLKVENEVHVKFEGIEGRAWDYSKAIEFLKLIPTFKQEEMDV